MRTGWLPDHPDIRDFDAELMRSQVEAPKAPQSAGSVDARKYCSPIENQGGLGSCVAQAVVGMVEYMERRLHRRHVNASRLFLYKMARQMDGIEGDVGCHIRTAMKALRIFGAPPEKHWPYIRERYDEDPTPFVFAYGQSLQSITYHRIDCGTRSRADCLDLIKAFARLEYPVVLGFSVYDSNRKGEFPMPRENDRRRGGHAVMVCGYDDSREIRGSRGALLIRNSWGRRWGDDGYGWLPYDYIIERLSADYWTLIRKESVL